MSLQCPRCNSPQVLSALPAIESELHRERLNRECQALEAMLLALDDEAEAGGQLASSCLPYLQDRPWISNTLINVICFSHLHACRWQEFYTLPPLAVTPLDPNRYLFNQVYRLCLMGFGEAMQGRFSQATTLFEEALRVTSSSRNDVGIRRHSVLRALPTSFLAGIRYLQGNIDEAERLSLESIETVKISGFLDCAGVLFITTSRLSSRHASPQGARYFLEEGDRLAQTRAWPRLKAQLLLERTRVSLLEQKQHEASACVSQLESLTQLHTADAGEQISEYACLASLAALWCEACDAHPRAADLVRADQLRQQAQQLNLRLMQIRLATGLALANWRRRHHDTAAAYLQEVAELMEHCDVPQVLIDMPAPEVLQQLVEHTLRLPNLRSSLKPRLQRLLIKDADTATSQTASRLMITLTGKERHVLELVAQGKSNKEIAKLLGIAPETIKSHMKHIFSKLQVDSRAQAAVAAKACGLI